MILSLKSEGEMRDIKYLGETRPDDPERSAGFDRSNHRSGLRFTLRQRSGADDCVLSAHQETGSLANLPVAPGA